MKKKNTINRKNYLSDGDFFRAVLEKVESKETSVRQKEKIILSSMETIKHHPEVKKIFDMYPSKQ